MCVVTSPLSTKWIEGHLLAHPVKHIHLELRPTSLKARTSSSRPSLPKSATRQLTCTQGESRSIRGIGVPPPAIRQSDTVSALGADHAVLRTQSIIQFPWSLDGLPSANRCNSHQTLVLTQYYKCRTYRIRLLPEVLVLSKCKM